MWFVVVAIALLFVLGRKYQWLTDSPASDSVYLLALAVGAYSLTVALKHAFALPRPPGAATATAPSWIPALGRGAYESLVTGDGFGFPSGHALKTTVVYGGAAFALDVWNRRRRLAVAGLVTALVAASRVFLGVHYTVDVVAGCLVGVAFLAVAIRLTDQRPARAWRSRRASAASRSPRPGRRRRGSRSLPPRSGSSSGRQSTAEPSEPSEHRHLPSRIQFLAASRQGPVSAARSQSTSRHRGPLGVSKAGSPHSQAPSTVPRGSR
nr:phosphatase PAP2 family protein [Halobacterium sp. CBA1126]